MNIQPGAALLFDIDGTLVDTDRLHLDAFNRAFAPFGHHFDAARFRAELQAFSMASIMDRFLFLPRLLHLADAPMAIVLGRVFAALLFLHLGNPSWAAAKREQQSNIV